MNYERVKAVFLSFLEKRDATPYLTYIESGITETERLIRPQYAENPPDCVNAFAAALAVSMYTEVKCAGEKLVCTETGTVSQVRNTDSERAAAAALVSFCRGLCSRYLTDDKFVMISTGKGA